MQSYIYMSNMVKAMRRDGEVWLGMAQEIMVEPGRKMKSLGPQGEMDTVELARPVLNTDTGETEYENDLSQAKFDVIATVGPSSSSKRQATVRNLMGMMQIAPDPETQQVLGSMIMMNMEGEGIEPVRDWFRKKLLRLGVVEPTEEEAKELAAAAQAQQPDPQAMLLQAAAMEAQAKALKAEADTGLSVAKTQQAQADTAKTLADIDIAERDQALKAAKVMADAISARAAPAVYQG
jgi:hypothetical protein